MSLVIPEKSPIIFLSISKQRWWPFGILTAVKFLPTVLRIISNLPFIAVAFLPEKVPLPAHKK
jgi:hypothetical protein